MSFSNFIFIVSQKQFDKRDYKRFGIDLFLESNCNVTVLDCARLVSSSNINVQCNEPLFKKHYIISSYSELNQILIRFNHNESIIICMSWGGRQMNKLWYAIKRSKLTLSVITLGATPAHLVEISNYEKGFWEYFLNLLRKPIGRFRYSFEKRNFPKVDWWLVSGKKSIDIYKKYLNVKAQTNIIWGHNFDYETYRETKIDSSDYNNEIIFLDQNLLNHPDFKRSGRGAVVSENKYYQAVNNYLVKLSKSSNCEISIAAHPTSLKTHLQQNYNDRTIYFNCTAEKISQSKAVICFCSTAIQFAILFSKPIILYTTDELESSRLAKAAKTYQKILGTKIINIDCDLNNPNSFKLPSVDTSMYLTWIDDFIKSSDSTELPLWNIYQNALNKRLLSPTVQLYKNIV